MKKYINNVTIEGARIGRRNFSGREERYNTKGHRYFLLYLDSELAKKMEEDGWNIKYLQPREEGEEPKPFISVTVMFGKIPPKIVLVNNGVQTYLDETNIELLDNSELENIDLVIHPYIWEMGGKTGVKAYVKTMYATLSQGDFAEKYSNVPIKKEYVFEENNLGVESDKLPF